jgi:hypothetical protein
MAVAECHCFNEGMQAKANHDTKRHMPMEVVRMAVLDAHGDEIESNLGEKAGEYKRTQQKGHPGNFDSVVLMSVGWSVKVI